MPAVAATCNTSEVLRGYDDALADISEDPTKLLLSTESWPQQCRKPFVKLDGTYSQLIKNACDVGLQELVLIG